MTPINQYKVDYFYAQSGLLKAPSEEAQLTDTQNYYNDYLKAFVGWSTESIENEARMFLINDGIAGLDEAGHHTIVYHIAQLVRHGVDLIELAKVLVSYTIRYLDTSSPEAKDIFTYYNSFHSALNALE